MSTSPTASSSSPAKHDRLTRAVPSYESAKWTGSVDRIFERVAPSDKGWCWNERALASLAIFGHTLGTDTLCEGVARVPPAERASLDWGRDQTIDAALEALKNAFRGCIEGAAAVHLSLSAGYDSRLLLALCISEGVRPHLSVMGYEDSTDVVIAKALGEVVGLPVRRIELSANDYLRHGSQIAFDTSGLKTAMNWHTWLYSRALDARDGIHLVGSNGEFARSFFLDSRRLNPLADVSPGWAAHAYWFARIQRRRRKFSRHNPILRSRRADASHLLPAALGSLDWAPRNLMETLDCFYTQQRVRHFIGAGLACYRAFGTPRSPFLDDDWIKTAARMTRHLKRDNHFHAEATRRLAPQLDALPYNKLVGGGQGPTYHPFAEVCRLAETEDIIVNSEAIDRWTTPSQRRAILEDHACDQLEERSLWLTLHFAGTSARPA